MLGPSLWRFGRTVDPFTEILRLRDQMNRLFSTVGYTATAAFPSVNIWSGKDGCVVTAELPGIDGEKLDISVLGDTLTIAGVREAEPLKGDESYHRKERNGDRFSRTLQLPFRIDSDKIEARYEKGVLSISLPREEADKPRKISIKAG